MIDEVGKLQRLPEAERELYETRVLLGVAVSFIPVDRVEAFRERLKAIREDEGPLWTCIECGSRYTADVGRCGQLQPFECRGIVVPMDQVQP